MRAGHETRLPHPLSQKFASIPLVLGAPQLLSLTVSFPGFSQASEFDLLQYVTIGGGRPGRSHRVNDVNVYESLGMRLGR